MGSWQMQATAPCMSLKRHVSNQGTCLAIAWCSDDSFCFLPRSNKQVCHPLHSSGQSRPSVKLAEPGLQRLMGEPLALPALPGCRHVKKTETVSFVVLCLTSSHLGPVGRQDADLLL